MENDTFWSEIGSGLGEPGGTPPPRIPSSTPPPPGNFSLIKVKKDDKMHTSALEKMRYLAPIISAAP